MNKQEKQAERRKLRAQTDILIETFTRLRQELDYHDYDVSASTLARSLSAVFAEAERQLEAATDVVETGEAEAGEAVIEETIRPLPTFEVWAAGHESASEQSPVELLGVVTAATWDAAVRFIQQSSLDSPSLFKRSRSGIWVHCGRFLYDSEADAQRNIGGRPGSEI